MVLSYPQLLNRASAGCTRRGKEMQFRPISLSERFDFFFFFQLAQRACKALFVRVGHLTYYVQAPTGAPAPMHQLSISIELH
jgi:hypothetical protein